MKFDMSQEYSCQKARYHLPGLFEFYELYRRFLPLYASHREYFYDWCTIGSVYGAPADCLWNGGRAGYGEDDPEACLSLMREYGIPARLTFSNSLLQEEHLSDGRCNRLCTLLEHDGTGKNGVIVHSELLLKYLREQYPGLQLISSTTKVITDPEEFRRELDREEFACAVPDFRLNPDRELWNSLTLPERNKVEFLCNECCDFRCGERAHCYEAVSRMNLGEDAEHRCPYAKGREGYRFSRAMANPGFIGIPEILEYYLPANYSNFKIEGRSLGSAVVLEFLLYYMVRPEYQLTVREEIYLDSMLDLF